jgi:hypothetical protein
MWGPTAVQHPRQSEKEFTAIVGLHPTDTKEAANALGRARRQVMGVQRVDRATYNLPRDKRDGNLNVAAPTHVNTHTIHTRCTQRGVEGYEITAKCSEIDGACIVYHPKLGEVTPRGCGGRERNRAKCGTSLYQS